MSLAALTAGGAPDWEGPLVAALADGAHGVSVSRRCVDVVELLAAAAAGVGRAALVAADLRGLDADVLTRLAVAGVAVIGVASHDDAAGRRRLERLGVSPVVEPSAQPEDIAATVLGAVGRLTAPRTYDVADPGAMLPRPTLPPDDVAHASGDGRVVAVWGPTGAPGRTSVAVNVAAELADLGVDTLLVDADVYGGVIAQLLGLLDESAGFAAACRAAGSGELDPGVLTSLSVTVSSDLRLLTGLARADRWPELRAAAVEAVLGCARAVAAVTVIDCGFCLERDEELTFDTAAPRRNGATLAALTAADLVVAVAAGDPVGLQRFVRAAAELGEAVPGCDPLVVVNRVRSQVVGGGDATTQISEALARFAGVHDARFVPLDQHAFDTAVASGRTLAEVAPTSPARSPLRKLAADVGAVSLPPTRRRVLSRLSR